MKYIRNIFVSIALVAIFSGCTSSGNDFFASLWSDVMAYDTPDSTQFAQTDRAPHLVLTVGHGAILRDASNHANAGDVRNTAMDMWRREAENGNAAAQFKLASAYRIGLNGMPDAKSALNWYAKAAARDHASAQHHLGYMYAMAEGASQDLVTAYTWLNLAVINLPPGWEHNQAVTNRERVAHELRPIEIAQAHALAQQWVRANEPVSEPAYEQTADGIVIEVDFQDIGFLNNLDPFAGESES